MSQTPKKELLVTAGVGVVLAFVGTIGWIQTGIMIYVLMHLVGIALFLECALFALQIKPLPRRVRKYTLHTAGLFALGVFTGVFFFDIPGLFIFRLWEYPFFSPLSNIWGYARVSTMWGLYFLIFHQSYILLYHFLHRRHHHAVLSVGRKKLLAFVGPLGIVLLLMSIALSPLVASSALMGFIATIGTWLILEGFEWPRKHKTLLLDLVSGNMRPLIAIISASLFIGFLSEFANTVSPIQHWVYFGIPWKYIHIFSVPLSLPLSWSMMYIIFLSLENLLIRTEVAIWD